MPRLPIRKIRRRIAELRAAGDHGKLIPFLERCIAEQHERNRTLRPDRKLRKLERAAAQFIQRHTRA